MKNIYLIALLIVIGAASLPAQTNVTDTPKSPKPPTVILSEHSEFDLTARRAIYWDNVRVDDPKMKLTCVRLTADLPEPHSEAQMRHIVAETNVVIHFLDDKGQTNHATSDKAIYHFEVQNGATNEMVTLSGNAKMEDAQGNTMTGEPIVWDRAKNLVSATNQKMVYKNDISSALANTNSPPPKTNFPPGTIPNTDPIRP